MWVTLNAKWIGVATSNLFKFIINFTKDIEEEQVELLLKSIALIQP